MTTATLASLYGDLMIVRPPVPATCNRAGANYKSAVTHLTYAPRRAYDEWLAILDGIVAFGGDAVAFEPRRALPRPCRARGRRRQDPPGRLARGPGDTADVHTRAFANGLVSLIRPAQRAR